MVTDHDNSAEAELRRRIATEPAGARLPSVRDLSKRYGAGPVTIQHLISRLEHEGLVEPRPGRGTFIAERRTATAGDWGWQTVTLGARPLPGEGLAGLAAEVPSGVISLSTGYPDPSLQAIDLLTTAAARAARRPGVWGRSPVEGLPGLRSWFAADIGGGVRSDDVVVIAGGQAALSAVFRGLASPGDAVVLESPTYAGAIDAVRLAGLRPVPVPTDAEGLRTDLLDGALRSSGARLVYVQPFAANPTGVTLTTERRAELLAVVRAHGAFVVEDDYARDLWFGSSAPRPILHDDHDGHVVYIRSLTKSAAPALRIAALVARGPLLARLRNARLVDDFFVSGFLQETALATITASGWPRHLARLRRSMGERMEAAVTAVDARPELRVRHRPLGGLALWIGLDDRLDDVVVARAALDAGVAVTPGRLWFCSEPPGSFVRISVAAADPSAITEGVKRLAAAIRRL